MQSMGIVYSSKTLIIPNQFEFEYVVKIRKMKRMRGMNPICIDAKRYRLFS